MAEPSCPGMRTRPTLATLGRRPIQHPPPRRLVLGQGQEGAGSPRLQCRKAGRGKEGAPSAELDCPALSRSRLRSLGMKEPRGGQWGVLAPFSPLSSFPSPA